MVLYLSGPTATAGVSMSDLRYTEWSSFSDDLLAVLQQLASWQTAQTLSYSHPKSRTEQLCRAGDHRTKQLAPSFDPTNNKHFSRRQIADGQARANRAVIPPMRHDRTLPQILEHIGRRRGRSVISHSLNVLTRRQQNDKRTSELADRQACSVDQRRNSSSDAAKRPPAGWLTGGPCRLYAYSVSLQYPVRVGRTAHCTARINTQMSRRTVTSAVVS